VAYRWRIRHKLILGLSLVIGIIALLLAGTLKGLLSYNDTVKSIESKVAEQEKAEEFVEVVGKLSVPAAQTPRSPGGTDEPFSPVASELPYEKDRLQATIEEAKGKLAEYERQLQDTLHRRRDPDKGYTETGMIEKLHEYFDELERAIGQRGDGNGDNAGDRPASQATTPVRSIIPATAETISVPLVDRPEVQVAIRKLVNTSNELRNVLYDNIRTRAREARGYYRNTLTIVISTSVCGILLMAGLLHFFYGWVFYPVRDLEVGAERVARGDFDHRIEVHSGDEMEDLAEAFNNMTSRLQEMYRDLAHQVNERSRQLVRSERLASVGFLAAGVAHEINNPLASIAFCSEALESRIAEVATRSPKDRDVVMKYLKMIQQEAFRCKAITQRLLEFSRSGERRREATDLAELIQSVLDVVQHLQNYKGKQVVFEPQGPIRAWVNAQEIKSVILNLVVNALDSMEEKGRLLITLRQRDRSAEMVFADNGCGMTAEILENIFEPFFTRSRTGKGTGLGLSISHRVITQHGGEIEASSPGLNQGSTFTVRLPLQPAETVKEESLGRAAA
jgi:two-component system, NtrC family, sensor kinase